MNKRLFFISFFVMIYVSLAAVANDSESRTSISGVLYFSPGCKICERLVQDFFPKVSEKSGISIEIEKRSVMDPAIWEELTQKLVEVGTEPRELPILILENDILQGEKEIKGAFDEKTGLYQDPKDDCNCEFPPYATRGFVQDTEKITGGVSRGGGEAKAVSGDGGPQDTVPLAILPVVSAGLLDGVNPCAFTTLIFLMAYLAMLKKDRREILLMGIVFSAAVFVTYFVLGLGALSALRSLSSFSSVAAIIRYIMLAFLLFVAVVSIRDFVFIQNGREKEISQLPDFLKKRIHSSIRSKTRAAGLIGGTAALGFLISVFELACTGQVYLPTIMWMIQARSTGYGYLILYNLAFILPLIIVFVITWAGVSSDSLRKLFTKHMGAVKIGTAIVMIAMGIVTVAGL